jgi:hypothetical protein
VSIWLIGWLGWLAWFVIEEGWAIYNQSWDGTLSYQIWRWLGLEMEGSIPTWVRVRRMAFIALFGFMIAHFFFRWV